VVLALLSGGCLSAPDPDHGVCDDLFCGLDGFAYCAAPDGDCAFVTELDGTTCRAACARLGTTCTTAYGEGADGSCSHGALIGCDAEADAAQCVCAPEVSSCTTEFGLSPGYRPCDEDTTTCTFYVDQLELVACDAICGEAGTARPRSTASAAPARGERRGRARRRYDSRALYSSYPNRLTTARPSAAPHVAIDGRRTPLKVVDLTIV
jgi:hypothetical protein